MSSLHDDGEFVGHDPVVEETGWGINLARLEHKNPSPDDIALENARVGVGVVFIEQIEYGVGGVLLVSLALGTEWKFKDDAHDL